MACMGDGVLVAVMLLLLLVVVLRTLALRYAIASYRARYKRYKRHKRYKR